MKNVKFLQLLSGENCRLKIMICMKMKKNYCELLSFFANSIFQIFQKMRRVHLEAIAAALEQAAVVKRQEQHIITIVKLLLFR